MNIDRDKLIEMAKEAGFKVNNFTVGGKEHFEICAIGTTCKVEITKFASLVSAHAITAMQTELDAAKEEADQNKRLFLQACQTLGKCGELLGIPEDETTGEPFELYDAIEQLQERVTSMQGDSEPTAYMSRKKMTDLAISMLPTKYARESKQSEGWSEWKPASIKDFEQHQQSIGKSDWMHDVEFIELFTHDRVKGVSDERVEFEVLFNKIKDLPRASFLLNSSGGVAKYLDKSGNWIEHYEVIKLLDQYLENLSQLSTNTDGWVSVSDRLPNDGDEVIGYGIWEGEIAGKSDGKSVEAGTWRNGEIQLSSDYYSVNLTDVTHWQPLPSPPINAISQDKGESV